MAEKKGSSKSKRNTEKESPKEPAGILVVDIGGTKVKVLASGHTTARTMPSGRRLNATKMVEGVLSLSKDWDYEKVSLGYPGLVGPHGPRSEPGNLGPGWVGFDFAAAFERPVRILNDAAMQALGSYEGGRMLFIGLGTGMGSTLIADHVIVPLELGRLLHDDGETLGDTIGRRGLAQMGKNAWNKVVTRVVTNLATAFVVDYVVLGGGNAKKVKELPPGARLGHNNTAFRGGFRLWNLESVNTIEAHGEDQPALAAFDGWRLI